MSTPVKVAGFLVALVAVFAAAWGVGYAVGPLGPAEVPAHEQDHGEDHAHGHAAAPVADDLVLDLVERTLPSGPPIRLEFTIRDSEGAAVTAYDVVHEKRLHLILVDVGSLRDYRHVHPTLRPDGTWVARLGPLTAGTSYRLFADGSTGGEPFLATADLLTRGSTPYSGGVPRPSRHDTVGGYDVRLVQRDGVARLEVSRDGRPVELEPYLGALGHLVVLRTADLDYVHVHPQADDAPTFALDGLGAGSYRYFFDFKADGVVHTAAFAVAPGRTAEEDLDDAGHDH